MHFYEIKMNKINLKFFGVTSWYESLGFRDSDTPSGMSRLKLRIEKKGFQKKWVFKKMSKRIYKRKR